MVDLFDIRNISNNIPSEFYGYFNKKEYINAQQYLKVNTRFSMVSSTFLLISQVFFIIFGGFNYVDKVALSFGFGPILTGLIFAGILFIIFEILRMPFSAYSIFIIEKTFGFNKMNIKTFITDLFKRWIITAILGTIVFSAVLWFFIYVHRYAWLYAFIVIIIFELLITFIAPIMIMPLFNKYTPLEDGILKTSIEKYAKKENFKIKGLFKMDGSKRSTKSNAFFMGFGKSCRIVLFDTLIQKHTVEELTSILAHEMGHFKLKHIIKHMILSFISIGIMLFAFSFFINKVWFYNAFLMQIHSIYAGIILFSFLYSPISLIISIILNYFSRKYEYEADIYAITTYRKPDAMISALKKLSIDNLSNLYPHKFKVFVKYSHPPVLKRIKMINKVASSVTFQKS
jgi:STE24 endopeptidase